MIQKLEKRKEGEKRAISNHDEGKVSDQELFRQLGNKVRIKK